MHEDRERQRALRQAARDLARGPARADDAGRPAARSSRPGSPGTWLRSVATRCSPRRDPDRSTPDARATPCWRWPDCRRAPMIPGETPSRARSFTSCARRARRSGDRPAHPLLRKRDATPLFLLLAGELHRWTRRHGDADRASSGASMRRSRGSTSTAIATATASSSTRRARQGRPAQPGLEGLRRLGDARRRHPGRGADRPGGGPGLRLPGEAARRRRLRRAWLGRGGGAPAR